jgi:asparagine N-glycosylation enzyme membrane subunit Stt3
MDKRYLRKITLLGLALAFIAIILSVLNQFTLAGIVFLIVVIIGVFGILKMYKK